MRKYLIVALAAMLSIAVAAVAVGQGAPASGTLKIKPSKAGTKKKPRAITLTLSVTNQTKGTTASRIEVFLPKFVRASGKGLPTCSFDKAASDTCPSGSKAGGGTADALLGPTSPNPVPLKFKVTAYNGGKNLILFKIDQLNNTTGQVIVGSGVHKVLEGKLSRASGANFYQKLRIDIPEDVQQPTSGAYSALESLKTTLHLKKGKKSLVSTIGCPKNKKHVLGVKLTYAPNPGPPPRPSSSAKATARCSK